MPWTTPPTWVAGQVVSVGDLNTYVRDNPSFLYGDTGWTSVTFSGTWSNFGGTAQAVQYRKTGTRVYLRGGAKAGTVGTVVFTLPLGYRPPANGDMNFAVDSGTGAFGAVGITSSGSVTPNSVAGNTYVAFDGIYFDTI